METANITVYGNIEVYGKIYTNMLKIHLYSIFSIKTARALTREVTDTCILTI